MNPESSFLRNLKRLHSQECGVNYVAVSPARHSATSCYNVAAAVVVEPADVDPALHIISTACINEEHLGKKGKLFSLINLQGFHQVIAQIDAAIFGV